MKTTPRRVLTAVATGAVALGLALATAGAASAQTPADDIHTAADKATQLHMQITNNTGHELVLVSAEHSGSGVHWQDRATDLAPNAVETVSAYAGGDTKIDLTFAVDTADGTQIRLHAKTPLIGGNTASGTSATDDYWVKAVTSSGYDPTDTFDVEAS